ncbi:MAG: hypothetical protein A2821_03645 [Candidatus Magasanikbacteria bacterium RIFCSPHIGHO2_01_FULL_41_23]|nr:MAG: hypothetical protein A2821_03645 [Candidatus Magasanikbacteria bacterium RIFCSPHIGHO2_01_FULL_41_23]
MVTAEVGYCRHQEKSESHHAEQSQRPIVWFFLLYTTTVSGGLEQVATTFTSEVSSGSLDPVDDFEHVHHSTLYKKNKQGL